MECLFIGVKKINCSLYQRCEGIYQIMLNLGADKQKANTFSKYVWRRYFYNKLNDIINDTSTGLLGITSKSLAKLLVFISKPLIRDHYGIEEHITSIEKQLILIERTKELIEPIDYFSKSGKGFGYVFSTAALISNCNLATTKEMNKLGSNLGILVTMRDSIQDRELDIKTGNYNPFRNWSKKEMIKYYHNFRKDLITEINEFVISNTKRNRKSKEQNRIFYGLNLYAQATANPFGLCKKYLNTNSLLESPFNLNPINYLIEPNKDPQQPEDSCRINCCASKCDDCCHIPDNPCKGCCDCCDGCISCCNGCDNCCGGSSSYSGCTSCNTGC